MLLLKLQDRPNSRYFDRQLMLRYRHFHGVSIPIRMIFRPRQVRIALASRTIVHDLMAENIAINAEMILASLALISARLASALGSFRARCIACTAVGALAGRWEGRQAAETLR